VQEGAVRFDHAQDLRRRAGASDHVVAGGRYDAISRAFAARAKPAMLLAE